MTSYSKMKKDDLVNLAIARGIPNSEVWELTRAQLIDFLNTHRDRSGEWVTDPETEGDEVDFHNHGTYSNRSDSETQQPLTDDEDQWLIQIAGVPVAVYSEYEAVRQSGLINMFDQSGAIRLMVDPEVVDYLVEHRNAYITIMQNYGQYLEFLKTGKLETGLELEPEPETTSGPTPEPVTEEPTQNEIDGVWSEFYMTAIGPGKFIYTDEHSQMWKISKIDGDWAGTCSNTPAHMFTGRLRKDVILQICRQIVLNRR